MIDLEKEYKNLKESERLFVQKIIASKELDPRQLRKVLINKRVMKLVANGLVGKLRRPKETLILMQFFEKVGLGNLTDDSKKAHAIRIEENLENLISHGAGYSLGFDYFEKLTEHLIKLKHKIKEELIANVIKEAIILEKNTADKRYRKIISNAQKLIRIGSSKEERNLRQNMVGQILLEDYWWLMGAQGKKELMEQYKIGKKYRVNPRKQNRNKKFGLRRK